MNIAKSLKTPILEKHLRTAASVGYSLSLALIACKHTHESEAFTYQ